MRTLRGQGGRGNDGITFSPWLCKIVHKMVRTRNTNTHDLCRVGGDTKQCGKCLRKILYKLVWTMNANAHWQGGGNAGKTLASCLCTILHKMVRTLTARTKKNTCTMTKKNMWIPLWDTFDFVLGALGMKIENKIKIPFWGTCHPDFLTLKIDENNAEALLFLTLHNKEPKWNTGLKKTPLVKTQNLCKNRRQWFENRTQQQTTKFEREREIRTHAQPKSQICDMCSTFPPQVHRFPKTTRHEPQNSVSRAQPFKNDATFILL